MSPDLVLKLLQSSILIYETEKTWNVNEEEPSAATNDLTLAGSPLARFGFDIFSQERNVLKTLFGKHCKDWFRNHCTLSANTLPTKAASALPTWMEQVNVCFFWNKAKHFPSHLKFQIIYYKRSPLESFSSLSRWLGAKVSQSWGEVTTFWRSKFRKCGMLKKNYVSCYRKDDTEGWIFTKMKEDHPECFLLFFWIFLRACRSD